MLKGMGGMGNILKQAQKMQQRLLEVQQELKERVVEGSAGGGMVRVAVNGQQEVLSVKIDPEEFALRTVAGAEVRAKRNWFTGLTPGARMERLHIRQTGSAGLLWEVGPDLVPVYYLPRPKGWLSVRIIVPGVERSEVRGVRFGRWAEARLR